LRFHDVSHASLGLAAAKSLVFDAEGYAEHDSADDQRRRDEQ
jgi:hypothetical protein